MDRLSLLPPLLHSFSLEFILIEGLGDKGSTGHTDLVGEQSER